MGRPFLWVGRFGFFGIVFHFHHDVVDGVPNVLATFDMNVLFVGVEYVPGSFGQFASDKFAGKASPCCFGNGGGGIGLGEGEVVRVGEWVVHFCGSGRCDGLDFSGVEFFFFPDKKKLFAWWMSHGKCSHGPSRASFN